MQFYIFIGLLGFVNVFCLPSDGQLNLNAQDRFRRQTQLTCRKYEFRCDSKTQCIPEDNLCDGTAQCKDKSDETLIRCSKQTCPPFSFQCAYGACVDGDAVCNGKKDCIDNSDEADCGTSPTQVKQCGKGKFTCKNGSCIDQYSLCDGRKDCTDGSDETSSVCRNITCTFQNFQCTYGACVDGDAACNGVAECADGSDEARALCPTSTFTVAPVQIDGCVLPKFPKHGKYTLNGNADVLPGEIAPNYGVLEFTCNPTYMLNNDKNIVCRNKNWNRAIPECQKTCPPRISTSLDITCTYNERKVSCDKPMLPHTKATFKCKLAYKISPPPSYDTSVCSDGTWDYPLYNCVPECGIKTPDGQQLVINGSDSKIGEYPWHVGLYQELTTDIYNQICGGSIISPKAVITAAHCFVFSRDPEIYAISAGNYYRAWKHPKDTKAQYIKALQIRIPDEYHGSDSSFQFDIALVVLKTQLFLSHLVRPVCMDWNNQYEDAQLVPGAIGHVAGWGLTSEAGEPSDTLKEIDLPYISHTQCFENSPVDFQLFLSNKICAGYLTGKSVCEGDSGGGLTFARENVYFLRGIVSVGPRKGVSCDARRYTTFTKVSLHLAWVKTEETNSRLPPKVTT